mgnify:FL=1
MAIEREKSPTGKVYFIKVGERKYYGSTIQKLNGRQKAHNFNLSKGVNRNLYNECRRLGITKIKCELLWEVDNGWREIEDDYIRNDPNCLNMCKAFATAEDRKMWKKKWRDDPKNKATIQKHYHHIIKWKKEHPERLREYNRQYRLRQKLAKEQQNKITNYLTSSDDDENTAGGLC